MFDLSVLEKHKKTIGLVCLAVFIGSFFVRHAINAYRHIADGHHPPPPKRHTLTPERLRQWASHRWQAFGKHMAI